MEPKRKSEYINRNMFWMAVGLLFIFFVYIFCITFIDIPDKNQKYVDIVLGFLSGTTVANIISYYFGTSNSNIQKEKNLDDMIDLHKETIKENKVQPVEVKNDVPIEVSVTDVPVNINDLPKPLDPDAT